MKSPFSSVEDFRRRFNTTTGASIDDSTAQNLLNNNMGNDQLGFMSDNAYLRSIGDDINSARTANYMKGLAASALAGDWKTKNANELVLSQNLLDADMYADLGLNPLDTSGGSGTTSGASTDWSKWFGDKGNQFMVQTGFGAANLGLGLASYLQQSDFMKKQGKVLDQQIANNDYNMDKQRTFDTERKATYARLNPTSNVG